MGINQPTAAVIILRNVESMKSFQISIHILQKVCYSVILGYTGDNCELNYDDCQMSTCKNNGTCVDGVDMYTCLCVPGYTDTNCSTEINECLSSPCAAIANCTDLLNAFEVRYMIIVIIYLAIIHRLLLKFLYGLRVVLPR